jgi:Polysaccharide pyruvyl transferase
MISRIFQSIRNKVGLAQPRARLQPLRRLVEDYLSQYRDTTVLFYPTPGNAGDSLLAVGTFQAFAGCAVHFRVIDLEAAVDGKIVFLGGGGNLVPLYDHIKSAYQKFLGRAQKIILLPHTIRGNEELLRRLDQTCTLFCRDLEGYTYVRSINPSSEVILAHDMAFHLNARGLLNNRELARAARPILRDKLRGAGITEDMIRQKSSIDSMSLLDAAPQLEALINRTKPFLDELRLNLQIVRTNLREAGLQDWEDSFMSQLACCLHNYWHDFRFALVGSSEPYNGLALPWGSNPATDYLL